MRSEPLRIRFSLEALTSQLYTLFIISLTTARFSCCNCVSFLLFLLLEVQYQQNGCCLCCQVSFHPFIQFSFHYVPFFSHLAHLKFLTCVLLDTLCQLKACMFALAPKLVITEYDIFPFNNRVQFCTLYNIIGHLATNSPRMVQTCPSFCHWCAYSVSNWIHVLQIIPLPSLITVMKCDFCVDNVSIELASLYLLSVMQIFTLSPFFLGVLNL